MRVSDLVTWAEGVAPTQLAESWDNVGLLVGDPADDVKRVLLTIDYTPEVAQEALDEKCTAVITYHPPIFTGLKRITAGSLIFDALKNGLSIYCFHTALDVAIGGTNDMLSDVLGLSDRSPLRPIPNVTDGRGMGRVGRMEPTPRRKIIERIKSGLGLPHVMVSGPVDGDVKTAAVCAGSCGDCLEDALRRGVDLYLTGELRHHDALKAASRGLTVVCTLHSNSERRVLDVLKTRLASAFPSLELRVSKRDRDPFQWL